MAKKKTKKATPRNEFHFHLQRNNKSAVFADKKKVIHRKQKYKRKEDI